MPLLILTLHFIHRLVQLQPAVALRFVRALALVIWLLHQIPAVQAFGPVSAFRLARAVHAFRPTSAPQPTSAVHASRHLSAPRPNCERTDMPPRCCHPIRDEFMPSYASVLVYGSDPIKLEQAVREAETQQRITSCFTAWCPTCASPYLLTTDIHAFPSPSAHHTHQLVLLSVLRESGALVPAEPV